MGVEVPRPSPQHSWHLSSFCPIMRPVPPASFTSCVLSHYVMSDSVTPWTVAHQAPLSMGFPRTKNTGVDCHFVLHRIVCIQGSNLHLLHWQVDSSPLSHQGSPGPHIRLGQKYLPGSAPRDPLLSCSLCPSGHPTGSGNPSGLLWNGGIAASLMNILLSSEHENIQCWIMSQREQRVSSVKDNFQLSASYLRL